jgi:putative restriction endonuclease
MLSWQSGHSRAGEGRDPILEGLKKLQRVSVHLPRRAKDYPDRDRLSLRFERFRAAY